MPIVEKPTSQFLDPQVAGLERRFRDLMPEQDQAEWTHSNFSDRIAQHVAKICYDDAAKTLLDPEELTNRDKKAAEKNSKATAYANLTEYGDRTLFDRFQLTYDNKRAAEQRKATAAAKNEPLPSDDISALQQALDAAEAEIPKVQDADQRKHLQDKVSAYKAWKNAEDEWKQACNTDPPGPALVKARQALQAAKADAKKYQDIEKWLRPAFADISNEVADVDKKLDQFAAKLPEDGAKASEDEKKAAKSEGRKQVAIWGGITTAAVLTAVTIAWVMTAQKQSHKIAHLQTVAAYLMSQAQAAQNSSPDQSQNGPPPSYAASQNAYGYSSQQPAQGK